MKCHPMHVVVGGVFILNPAFASSAPIELQKSIISKPIPCADMLLKVERYDLVVNPEHVQGTSEN
jgi:hypothetical protein